MSTGQGVVGSNMYAYCLSNPQTLSDDHGTISNRNLMMTDGGGKSKLSLKSKLEVIQLIFNIIISVITLIIIITNL